MPVPFLPAALGANGSLQVDIAWGADLAAAAGTWVWTDVTADVRQDPGISTSRGRGDEASSAQPAACTLTLDNTVNRYGLGPAATNYPNVRRGTPVRVMVRAATGVHTVVFLGNAVGFTPSWNLRGGARVVTLTAAGTLRRLRQGGAPVVSPIRRVLLSKTSLVAYWPFEDGKQATTIASGMKDGLPLTFSGIPDLAASTDFVASRALPAMRGCQFVGGVRPYTSTGSWQVRALVLAPATGQVDSVVLRVYTTGSAARWDVTYAVGGGGQIGATVYDRVGLVITTVPGVNFQLATAPRTRRWGLAVETVGADIVWKLGSQPDRDGVIGGLFTAPTLVGHTVGVVTSVEVNPDGLLDQVTVGHVSVQSVATDLLTDRDELRAFFGEVAFVRFARLCVENGIVQSTLGDGGPQDRATDKMGTQTIADASTLLREVEIADQGVIVDGVTAGLQFFTRRNAENQTPILTVSATALQLAGPFQPIDDDQRTRNRVEVSRTNGASATVEDLTGLQGISAVGLYDESVEVNTLLDSSARVYAGWFLSRGTVPGYRYAELTVNLLAQPALAAAWLIVRPGLRVDVTGVDVALPGHPGETLSLIVESVSNDITGATWRGTAVCSPYEPWRIGVVATATGSIGENVARATTSGSTTSAAAIVGATTLAVATTVGPLWSTVADDYPLTLEVRGAPVRATACAGAASPQTFTIDALTVARPSGSAVGVWLQPALGL